MRNEDQGLRLPFLICISWEMICQTKRGWKFFEFELWKIVKLYERNKMSREARPPPPKKYRTIKQGLEKFNFGASKHAIRGSRAPAPPPPSYLQNLVLPKQFPYRVQKGPSSTLLDCLVLWLKFLLMGVGCLSQHALGQRVVSVHPHSPRQD